MNGPWFFTAANTRKVGKVLYYAAIQMIRKNGIFQVFCVIHAIIGDDRGSICSFPRNGYPVVICCGVLSQFRDVHLPWIWLLSVPYKVLS